MTQSDCPDFQIQKDIYAVVDREFYFSIFYRRKTNEVGLQRLSSVMLHQITDLSVIGCFSRERLRQSQL